MSLSTRVGRWGGTLAVVARIIGSLLALSEEGLAQASGPPLKTTPLGPTLDRLRESTTRPVPSVQPAPRAPATDMIWVPDRHVQIPGVEGSVWVPGHWERKISDQEHFAPPLVGRTPGGAAVNVPAGTRPPVQDRQGP